LAKHLKYTTKRKIESVEELIKSASPELKNDIVIFCRWITELYQYNQAVHLLSRPNLAHYDSHSIFTFDKSNTILKIVTVIIQRSG